jgi:hypothetical protein
MIPRLTSPSAEALARIRALSERRLSQQELAGRLGEPVSAEEQQETRELIRWFRRRYPTPGARMAYARRKWAEWSRSIPPGARERPADGGSVAR